MSNESKAPLSGEALAAAERQLEEVVAAEKRSRGEHPTPGYVPWTAFDNGGLEYNPVSGFSSNRPVEATSGQFSAPQSLMDTITRSHGGPLDGEMRPDDIVTVGGMEMSVSAACELRWMRCTGHGQYEATTAGEAAFRNFNPAGAGNASAAGVERNGNTDQQQNDQQDVPEPIERLSDDVEKILSQHAQAVGPAGADMVVECLIEHGEVPDGAAHQLAQRLGMSAAQVREDVGKVQAAMEDQAYSKLQVFGRSGEDVSAWLWANRGPQMRAAIDQHIKQGTTAAYTGLAREYVVSLERTTEGRQELLALADLPAGWKMIQRGGRVGVQKPDGGSMSWTEVVDAGLIPGLPVRRRR